jgi:hypothetical protein
VLPPDAFQIAHRQAVLVPALTGILNEGPGKHLQLGMKFFLSYFVESIFQSELEARSWKKQPWLLPSQGCSSGLS